MIQIVKPGHKYYEITCQKCDCVFKFEECDIEDKHRLDDDGGTTWATSWTLTCPWCSNKVTTTDILAKRTWIE